MWLPWPSEFSNSNNTMHLEHSLRKKTPRKQFQIAASVCYKNAQLECVWAQIFDTSNKFSSGRKQEKRRKSSSPQNYVLTTTEMRIWFVMKPQVPNGRTMSVRVGAKVLCTPSRGTRKPLFCQVLITRTWKISSTCTHKKWPSTHDYFTNTWQVIFKIWHLWK